MSDGVEILKWFIGMVNIIEHGGDRCPRAWAAAFRGGDIPTILGAVDIFRFVVNLPSEILDEIWR
jgi:hypothetical protein